MRAMLNAAQQWFAASPRRLVLAGLWMFFAGAVLLLLGLVGTVAPDLPLEGLAPQGALGFTAAATLVCWGVWAMGSGLKLARSGDAA